MSSRLQRFLPLILLLPAGQVLACATCLCGDPTITTMGTEKPFAGRLRAGVEYLTRDEDVGKPWISEHQVSEERMTMNVSYAISESWVIAASVPLVDKRVERFDLSRESSSGVGDSDITVRWFAGGDQAFPRHNVWGLVMGLRVPTSAEEKVNGTPVDFDAQAGAGTTIPSLGLWYGHYAMPWFFYGSAVVQHAVDKGYQGYQAGDVLLVTGLAQYAVHRTVAVQLSLDGRQKEHDRYHDVRDDDSGGLLVMASPGIAITPFTDLVVNLSYQLPLVEQLNGEQEEKPVFRAGVTYDF